MSKASKTLTAGRPSKRAKTRFLAKLADDQEFKRVNFDLSIALHAKLKIYATKQGKSIKEVLTDYVATLPK